jgi:hypothetical protein
MLILAAIGRLAAGSSSTILGRFRFSVTTDHPGLLNIAEKLVRRTNSDSRHLVVRCAIWPANDHPRIRTHGNSLPIWPF